MTTKAKATLNILNPVEFRFSASGGHPLSLGIELYDYIKSINAGKPTLMPLDAIALFGGGALSYRHLVKMEQTLHRIEAKLGELKQNLAQLQDASLSQGIIRTSPVSI